MLKPKSTLATRRKLSMSRPCARQRAPGRVLIGGHQHPGSTVASRNRAPPQTATGVAASAHGRHQAEEQPGQQRDYLPANHNTVPFTPISSARGIDAGSAALRNGTAPYASSTPAAPPLSASIPLSVRTWRAKRCQVAPSARRTAISRSRPNARANSRFAIFAHAISRTNEAADMTSNSAGRASSNCLTSLSLVTLTPQPPSSSG